MSVVTQPNANNTGVSKAFLT